MKRIPILVITALILACSGIPGTWSHAASKEVVVLWDTKASMPNNVVMGFLPAMRNLAPDVKVTLHRDLKDMEEAKKVFNEAEARASGIVFLRPSGAEYLATVTPKVPCFVGACNNPKELGVIKNLSAPEGMITGVTYYIPYETRIKTMLTLLPNVKKAAILIEKGHPAGPIELAGTREACKASGIECKEVVASNLNDLLQQTRDLGKVDVLILSSTRLATDSIASLLPIVNPSKTPMFSYAEKPVKSGAVAGIAADDMKLGAMLAESVVEVIVRGKPVSQVPVKMDPDPKILINDAMRTSLGLQFPAAIKSRAVIVQ